MSRYTTDKNLMSILYFYSLLFSTLLHHRAESDFQKILLRPQCKSHRKYRLVFMEFNRGNRTLTYVGPPAQGLLYVSNFNVFHFSGPLWMSFYFVLYHLIYFGPRTPLPFILATNYHSLLLLPTFWVPAAFLPHHSPGRHPQHPSVYWLVGNQKGFYSPLADQYKNSQKLSLIFREKNANNVTERRKFIYRTKTINFLNTNGRLDFQTSGSSAKTLLMFR